ncbi:MAG: 4-(cytidine 5'-diphospho)-2-C-methyl-D-erythritol kinase [Methylobacteriaceae bacterium]|jgi:4-diphosphocytidyl-2-C-methyl-D-erythritol kinase|nr:4-(cytidine 5'-diphospho)-2-C-methyl-D-erythritol kinase [Methylobacteriaceae bacterium]
MQLTERGPAKVNLSLHVVGRRADGFHLLESLVAFADPGSAAADGLSLEPGAGYSLAVEGERGGDLGDPADNLVTRAVQRFALAFPGCRTGAFRLTKALPVASGIGGGSADAGAALRLMARLNGIGLDHPLLVDAAASLGGDVPVCLFSKARLISGIGHNLGPVLDTIGLPAVLANPGVPLATADVFRESGLKPGARRDERRHPPLPAFRDAAAMAAFLRECRNDLEPAAFRLAPVVAAARDTLARISGCLFARMSGSGGTVFGLFANADAARAAALELRSAHPGWWVQPTLLG